MSPKSFSLWVPSSTMSSPQCDFSHHFQRVRKRTFLLMHDPAFSRVSCPRPGWTPLSHQSALNAFLVCHAGSRESGGRGPTFFHFSLTLPPWPATFPPACPLSPPTSPAAANTYRNSTLSLNFVCRPHPEVKGSVAPKEAAGGIFLEEKKPTKMRRIPVPKGRTERL